MSNTLLNFLRDVVQYFTNDLNIEVHHYTSKYQCLKICKQKFAYFLLVNKIQQVSVSHVKIYIIILAIV